MSGPRKLPIASVEATEDAILGKVFSVTNATLRRVVDEVGRIKVFLENKVQFTISIDFYVLKFHLS